MKNKEFSFTNMKMLESMIEEKIKSNPSILKYVKNPTEEMCLIAVKKSGYYLGYIKNPTEKVVFEALKENPKRKEFLTKNLYDLNNLSVNEEDF